MNNNTIKNITEPNVLNIKWISDALLPFVEAPKLESNAVTQEPILVPKTMNNAVSTGIIPPPAITIIIPAAAEDDWTKAVNKAPNKINNIGKSIAVNKFWNNEVISGLLLASKAPLIISNPTKITPRPQIIEPINLTSILSSPFIFKIVSSNYGRIVE